MGRLKEKFYIDAAREYAKRLGGLCRLDICEIEPVALPQEPGEKQIEAALEKERTLIEKRLTAAGAVYALCIEGDELSSEQLSKRFENEALRGRSSVNFIIGSSYGLSPAIKAAADCRLSMSRMTFPHRLARIMLLEQIYRALSITAGSKYHK